MATIDSTLIVSVTANSTSGGQGVDLSGYAGATLAMVNDLSGVAIQYALDGVTWQTLGVGAWATFVASVPSAVRFRKTTADNFPVPLTIDFDAQDGVLTPAQSVALQNIRTGGAYRLFDHSANTAGANFTFLMQFPALAPFYGFRPIYLNYAASQTITLAKSAVSDTAGNVGTGLTWSSVTFGGSTSGTQPAGSGSAQDVVPGLLVGDWNTTASIARTDFPGRNPLVQIRTQYALASSQQSIFSNAFGDVATATNSALEFAGNVSAGDLVTTISSMTPIAGTTWMCPVGVEFSYGVPTYTVADVGDSLMRGQESSTTSNGWLSISQRACSVKSGGISIWQPASFSVTGQGHNASYLTGLEVVSKLAPRYLCFRAWSPNDCSPTQALIDASWARTLALIEHCRRNNVIPVLCTTIPRNSLTSSQDAFLKLQNARVKALAGSLIVSDEAAVIEDPSNRGQILPAFNSDDGLHLTSAGYAAMAAVRAAALAI